MALPTFWPKTTPFLPGFAYGVVISLYSADPAYEFEIQRATDALGTGATSIATNVPSGNKVYVDASGNDNTTYFYRVRHTLVGETPSAWTCWKAGLPQLLLAGTDPEQAPAVLPVVAAATSFDGTTATLTLTIDDQQCRVTKVEAQTTTSAGTVSAWTTLTAVAGVYTQTVAQGGPTGAKIAYRIEGYNAKNDLVYLEQDTTVFPAGSASTTGPSLDVRAVGGSTQWTIYWSGAGVLLSIDNGSFATPPASPIIVTRPAAGATDLTYTFKNTLNGQTVLDTVAVPALDKDSVPADLVVNQGTMTATTVTFTTSAVRGDTGAAITVQVTLTSGMTATNNGTPFSSADGFINVAGPIVVNRPSWGTAQDGAVKFRTYPTTGVTAEEAMRTVLRQEKTSFGPTLDVSYSVSSTSYQINYNAPGNTTIEYAINGGAHVDLTPNGNPSGSLIRTRPNFGSPDDLVTIFATKDGQMIANTVTVVAKTRDTLPVRIRLDHTSWSDNGDGTGDWIIHWRFYTLDPITGAESEVTGSATWLNWSNTSVAKSMLTGTTLSSTSASNFTAPFQTHVNPVPSGEGAAVSITIGQGGLQWDGSQLSPTAGATLNVMLPPVV